MSDHPEPGPSKPQGQGAGMPPQTLADILADSENANANLVMPKPWCEHLKTNVTQKPWTEVSLKDPCQTCGNVGENWLCLICQEVHCSRYVQEHMLFHSIENHHLMSVSFSDLSAWCYGCEEYIDNPCLYDIKNKLHVQKFGIEMPKSSNMSLNLE
ncbi:hypothetical protein TCAL_06597 [Tigriopus californicus]|uniref:UBP-type domain-containing protein n=1 Tax=Tigriopus californicus TaxID=6832 RepID=A0A553PN68_TIGCA|nr:hypothetical protein TCAL_06597 [Tigriopus californicus]|eukprot:TCALIF_06597-PA protein Name:"Similar to HDAC6 Histone deacetylase 6 (Homo sapiens)" AED:0.55 eAED:0.56 QI:0/-1/0/1/-1/1/1/0/155